jgi:hypothetical protein
MGGAMRGSWALGVTGVLVVAALLAGCGGPDHETAIREKAWRAAMERAEAAIRERRPRHVPFSARGEYDYSGEWIVSDDVVMRTTHCAAGEAGQNCHDTFE